MQLILELLKKIFVALSGIYTKQETDSTLAVKADKADVEAEAKARQEADDTAAQERESARLREQWKSQTYAEFVCVNTSTTKTQYKLWRIKAIGSWCLDLGDGNGAQLQTVLETTPVLDFGGDSQRRVRIFGMVTEITSDAAKEDCFVFTSGTVVSKILVSHEGLTKYRTNKDTELFIESTSVGDIGFVVGQNAKKITYIGDDVLNAGFADADVFYVNSATVGKMKFYSASSIPTQNASITFKEATSIMSVQVSNWRILKSLTIDAPKCTNFDVYFAWMGGLSANASVNIRLPAASKAWRIFGNYSGGNKFSLKQMLPTLESLPVWTDGKEHLLGVHCYYTETTETFTATDADGVEYSLENCPSFDEDDAEQTFRKAYVLTIAKKGWTILLQNKNV